MPSKARTAPGNRLSAVRPRRRAGRYLWMILEHRAVGPVLQERLRPRLRGDPRRRHRRPGRRGGRAAGRRDAARACRSYILLTHAHLDHITGVGRAKAALGVPVWLHEADNFLYEAGRAAGADVRPPRRAAAAGRSFLRGRRAAALRALRRCACGTRPATVPAASAWRSAREGDAGATLFVGDTLFAGSIGRTDLPGGDMPTLLRSIRDVLFSLPGRHGRLVRPRRADDDRPRAADEPFLVDLSSAFSVRVTRVRLSTSSTRPTPSRSPFFRIARSVALAVDVGAVRALEVHDFELGRARRQPAVQPRHQRRRRR